MKYPIIDPLVAAVSLKDNELVEMLVDAEIGSCDDALYLATQSEKIKMMQVLIPKATADGLNKALVKAAMHDHIEPAKILLEAGADVYSDNKLAIAWAVNNGHIVMAKMLLKVCNKKIIKEESEIREVFICAIECSNAPLVKKLLEDGIDVDLCNEALLIAVLNNCVDMVNMLLETADVHYRNGRALYVAVNHGFNDLVNILLKAGADVHARDEEALISAVDSGYTEIVKMLLKAGADVHARNEEALFSAVYVCQRAAIVEVLLKAGADIHARNDSLLYGSIDDKIAKVIFATKKQVINISLNKNCETHIHLQY